MVYPIGTDAKEKNKVGRGTGSEGLGHEVT